VVTGLHTTRPPGPGSSLSSGVTRMPPDTLRGGPVAGRPGRPI